MERTSSDSMKNRGVKFQLSRTSFPSSGVLFYSRHTGINAPDG